MALLVMLFLVLVNIFNTVTTNTPKAEGLTAIEAWMLACILFVFGKNLHLQLLTVRNILISTLIACCNKYCQWNLTRFLLDILKKLKPKEAKNSLISHKNSSKISEKTPHYQD